MSTEAMAVFFYWEYLMKILFFLLAACGGLDNDGYTVAQGDCNDSNPEIYPGAFEACDGQDNDCDGQIDEDCDVEESDADADSDADGDSDADSDTDTDLPDDTAEDTAEPCEELDWFRDADGDSFGNPDVSISSCEQPDGYVEDNTDCDDNAANVHPGSGEWCNGVDDDCDGDIDESTSNKWYTDADGDGFGDESTGVDVICDGSAGTLVAPSDVTGDGAYDFDCDDTSSSVYPSADEYCNGEDDDCDGTVDNDTVDVRFWIEDADGDGHGNPDSILEQCADPGASYELDLPADDCDDASASVYPGATEQCNGMDDDCDGALMDSEVDNDGDGANECADGDCDDSNAAIYVGAVETCNGVDDDCDGVADESDAMDATTWYYDVDGDGYGDDSVSFVSCSAPAGYVAMGGDCDGTNAAVNPGATEVCDGVDNDCDGTTDVGAADQSVWSIDADGDGYGSDSYSDYLASCEQPDGYVADFSDCDDTDAAVNPGATEVYDDLVDNDCDGTVDNSAVVCYLDADGDGYGLSGTGVYEETGICDVGYVDRDSDCDDTNSTINPGADDPLADDGVDYNCDGLD
jgi:hypothetical protein